MRAHGHTAYARHSFDARTNEANDDAARVGARIQKRRLARNEACANARHEPRDCEDCDAAQREVLLSRFRDAEREGTRILTRGIVVESVTPRTNAPPAALSEADVLRAIIAALGG